ncbi:TolC family protein [Nostoc sp. MG11]|uniref:TolC family protein n=1 Tax=Nostoc sp. MG11 TaxID=2721166 RepID=UPI001D010813|nr:TolC family protein [Nostoc sp. MG11]
MQKQPEKNTQSSKYQSFISVFYWNINCVGVFTTILSIVFLIVSTSQSQLTLRKPPKAQVAVKQKIDNPDHKSTESQSDELQLISLNASIPFTNLVGIKKKLLVTYSKFPLIVEDKSELYLQSGFNNQLQQNLKQFLIPQSFLQSFIEEKSEQITLPLLAKNKELFDLYSFENGFTEKLFPLYKIPKQTFLTSNNTNFQFSNLLQLTQKHQEQPNITAIDIKNSTQIERKKQISQLPESRKIQISLSDVVFLVLENNIQIKNAYLERIAQKQDLVVEEGKFVPNFTPNLLLSTNQQGSLSTNLGANVIVKIPTGGELGFALSSNSQTSGLNSSNRNTDDNASQQDWQLTFRQPLLRGGGIEVNRASIEIARLNEKSNIQGLKSTLINTITESILAYRELLRAQGRLKNEQISLQNAQESLKVTQVLIEAGRIAPVDIIQNQTDIANRRVSLLAAENELDSRKLALLSILGIDKNLNIEAGVIPKVVSISLDFNQLRQIALSNQPNYLQTQLALEKNKHELLLAEDNSRWNLSLDASLIKQTTESADGRIGLNLSRTLGDLTIQQRIERSRVNLRQAKNNLQDANSRLDIQLQDRIRDVNLSFSRVELAQQARQLSERQLNIEQQKQKLGRGAGLFEIIRLQNELAEVRNTELDAIINYLNALTNLDQLIGTTLQTWQIRIQN